MGEVHFLASLDDAAVAGALESFTAWANLHDTRWIYRLGADWKHRFETPDAAVSAMIRPGHAFASVADKDDRWSCRAAPDVSRNGFYLPSVRFDIDFDQLVALGRSPVGVADLIRSFIHLGTVHSGRAWVAPFHEDPSLNRYVTHFNGYVNRSYLRMIQGYHWITVLSPELVEVVGTPEPQIYDCERVADASQAECVILRAGTDPTMTDDEHLVAMRHFLLPLIPAVDPRHTFAPSTPWLAASVDIL